MRNCYLAGIGSWNTQSKSGWGGGRRTGVREKGGGDRGGGEDKKKEVVKEEKKDKGKKENDNFLKDGKLRTLKSVKSRFKPQLFHLGMRDD